MIIWALLFIGRK